MDAASPVRSPAAGFSVVVPAFNEAQRIAAFHHRMADVMDRLGGWEADLRQTTATRTHRSPLHALRRADPHVAIVNLSRNFSGRVATRRASITPPVTPSS